MVILVSSGNLCGEHCSNVKLSANASKNRKKYLSLFWSSVKDKDHLRMTLLAIDLRRLVHVMALGAA